MAAGYEMRVGDAEREAAAAELREHFASGRLTQEELNERLDRAFAAKTRGDLHGLFTDLPFSGQGWARAGQAGAGSQGWSSGAAGGPFGSPGPFGNPGPFSSPGPFGGGGPFGPGGPGGYARCAGRTAGAFVTMSVVMVALFVVGILGILGIFGGGRPFGIVIILAAFALLRRLLLLIFGRRRGGRGGGRGPRRSRRRR